MLQDGGSTAIVDATFRVLERRRSLAHLPLADKETVFTEVGASCGAIGWHDFVDALGVVARLLNDSYAIAEQARDLGEPDDVAVAKLKALHPGLSSDVIGGALSYGWFASR